MNKKEDSYNSDNDNNNNNNNNNNINKNNQWTESEFCQKEQLPLGDRSKNPSL